MKPCDCIPGTHRKGIHFIADIKMTHLEMMVACFNALGGTASLEEILTSGERWSYEFRARATDLRKKGYTIVCKRGTIPSFNQYTLTAPDANGQVRMA